MNQSCFPTTGVYKLRIMKKAIVFTALGFSAATLSAQYNIDLSRVTPPSIEYLKMGNTGPKGKEIRVNNLYMDEATQTLDRTLMQKMQTTSPIPYPC